MKRELSIYLDLVRFLAAVLVVIYHSNTRLLVKDVLPLSGYGHSAVIVFFVLSGYVIAYVTQSKETTPRKYWISCSARIYSVTLAALALAFFLDPIGAAVSPEFYTERMAHDYWFVRLISSMLFVNEIWFVSIMSFSNVPYWSLNYEVWYYVIFAAATFLSGRKRLGVLAAIFLFLGPKILLLAPIWWLGVYLHRSAFFASLSERWGWILFVGSSVLIWQFLGVNVEGLLADWLKLQIGEHWYHQLTFSRYFLSDYLLGPLVFLNFAGFRIICGRFSVVLLNGEKLIRWLAGYTFSIYLFHQPLLLFYSALIDGDPNGYLFYTQVMVATVISTLLLGSVTEQRKAFFRRMATKAYDGVEQFWLSILRRFPRPPPDVANEASTASGEPPRERLDG